MEAAPMYLFGKFLRSLSYIRLCLITSLVIGLFFSYGVTFYAHSLSSTLAPTEDTFVDSANPNNTHGNNSVLEVDGSGSSPVEITFFKFNLSSLAGQTISSAIFKVYVSDASPYVKTVRVVSNNSWTEGTMTWNNKPAAGSVITTFTTCPSNSWCNINITSAVNTYKGGTLSIQIDQSSGVDGFNMRSTEATNPPGVDVTYTSAATPTSTPTPTPTPTPIPPPAFDSFSLSCAVQNNQTSPYKISANIATSAPSGSTIAKNFAIIAPKNASTKSYTYSTSTNTVSSTYLSESVNVASFANVAPSNSYIISNRVLTPSGGSTANFTFDIDFQNNSSFFNTFLNGFDLYLYIEDSGGRNNTGATGTNLPIPKVKSNYTYDPFWSCAKAYYSAINGDYRSNEPGSYQGQSGLAVTYGVSRNKYWQATNATKSSYEAYDNDVSSYSLPFTSNFSYEVPDTSFSHSTSAVSSFNTNVNSALVQTTRENLIGNLSEIMDQSVSSGFLSRYSYKDLLGAGASEASATRTISLDLGATTVNNAIIEVTDSTNTFNIVDITDSITSPASNIIIWCKIPACNMKIKALNTINDINLAANRSLSYDKTTVQGAISNNSRIYFNYLTGESATTPITTTQTYGGGTISKTRTVELIAKDQTKTNFYLGAIMTNGYLYSSTSERSDVLKGLVLARGTVANSINGGTRNLYFKDFPKPFLLIDFDPKYPLKFVNQVSAATLKTKFHVLGL